MANMYRPGTAEDWEPGQVRDTQPVARRPWNGWDAAREERVRIMERLDDVNARLDDVNARLDDFTVATNARLEEQNVVLAQLKHMLAELLHGGGGARMRHGDGLEDDADGEVDDMTAGGGGNGG